MCIKTATRVPEGLRNLVSRTPPTDCVYLRQELDFHFAIAHQYHLIFARAGELLFPVMVTHTKQVINGGGGHVFFIPDIVIDEGIYKTILQTLCKESL